MRSNPSPLSISPKPLLPQSPCLALRLEQAEDVILTDCDRQHVLIAQSLRDAPRTGPLDVADDAAGRVVHEFNANLRHTTTGACISVRPAFLNPAISSLSVCHTSTSQNLRHLRKLDGNPAVGQRPFLAPDRVRLGLLGGIHVCRLTVLPDMFLVEVVSVDMAALVVRRGIDGRW